MQIAFSIIHAMNSCHWNMHLEWTKLNNKILNIKYLLKRATFPSAKKSLFWYYPLKHIPMTMRGKFFFYVWLREWSIQIKTFRLIKLQNSKQHLKIYHYCLAAFKSSAFWQWIACWLQHIHSLLVFQEHILWLTKMENCKIKFSVHITTSFFILTL